jgi:FkbM family methyltransferase
MKKIKTLLFRFFAFVGLKKYYYYLILGLQKITGKKTEDYDRLKRFYSMFISQGFLVFDIGANIGNRSVVFRDLGARVVAIEPNPNVAEILKFRFGKSIQVENIGLADKEGSMDFYIASNSRISSFSTKFKEHKLDSNRLIQYNKKISVQVSTLDTMIQKYGVPDFCKIDTEGFEEQVLSGLSKKIKVLSFEFTFPVFYHETVRILNRLNELGYSEFNISIAEMLKLNDSWDTYEGFLDKIHEYEKSERIVYGDIYIRK